MSNAMEDAYKIAHEKTATLRSALAQRSASAGYPSKERVRAFYLHLYPNCGKLFDKHYDHGGDTGESQSMIDKAKKLASVVTPDTRAEAEIARLTKERDDQYDENVNRIAAEGAAILRAEKAEAELAKMTQHAASFHAERDMAEAALAAAKAENERLRKALAFYANPEVYKPHPHGPAFDRRDRSYVASAATEEPQT